MRPRIYDVTEQWEAGEYPAALAIGDSWFWYLNENLISSLMDLRQLKPDHSIVQLLGFNGAKLAEFIEPGQHAKNLDHFMKVGWREGFSEFYISGAGNDALELRLALKQNCDGIKTAADCFDTEKLRFMLAKLSAAIGSVIHNIQWAYRDDGKPLKKFFIHGYDYPVPDGRGFLNKEGWLKPKLDAALVERDKMLRYEIVKILIDKLNEEVFKPYHSPANGVYYVDTRGTLSRDDNKYKDDWANEMHPTSAGFAKIAQRWLPTLRSAGLVYLRDTTL